MLKKTLKGCFVFILLGCNMLHMNPGDNKSDQDKIKFIEYVNNNKVDAIADGFVISDKKFRLMIPESLSVRVQIRGGAFIQILSNNEHETIMTLFDFGGNHTPVIDRKDITHKQFISLCENEGIFPYFEDEVEIQKKCRFGVYKPTEEPFYVIYLNVEKSHVSFFNYSISSVKFD